MQSYFIHADLDAFYASVEQLDHPEYKGKPVIVGGLPGDRRSVVSTASYEARRFGVHSAMPIATAVRLCPNGIYLRGNMARYREVSNKIMILFENFSPTVQQLSIDEAFIDITGTENLLGHPDVVAKKLKDAIKSETGLTISVGIATNKYIAKIASGMSKPDGLFYIRKGEEETFMRSLPISKIWGAGEKTQHLLTKYELTTCNDIYELPLNILISIVGEAMGTFLYKAVRGEPAAAFEEERGSHSISNERTFSYDIYDTFILESVLMDICEGLIWRILENKLKSRTVFIKLRYGDFTTETSQITKEEYVKTLDVLYDRLVILFRKKYQRGKGIRLIGAGLMNLEDINAPEQAELFGDKNEKEAKLEKTIFEINKKFPDAVIRRSRSYLGEDKF
jgi:DNA polymerase-4